MKEDKTNGGYRVVTEETKSNRIYKITMLIILVVFITFIITSITMYSYLTKDLSNIKALTSFLTKDTSTANTEEKLKVLKDQIDKYYTGKIDEQKLQDGALKGYIEALDDPYTEYIPKDEMEDYETDLSGEFIGIGVYLVQDKQANRIKVVVPIKGTPAERAGIQSSDLIKSVDGEEFTADQMSELVEKVKGKEGTELKLQIIRGEEELEFTIKREKIKLDPVEGEILENNIGYIAFSSFDESTANDFTKKYQELKDKGITSLIIDLRNNGGGIVNQATQIAGTILDKNSVVLYEIDKQEKEEEIKTETDPIIDVPVVVLVNENTASSSEILAGALKDHGKAKIVGKTTYGKGVIQQLLTFQDGSGMKITCKEYLTPKRNKINEVGIEPDETVELPEELNNKLIIERNEDTQLQKAIEMLK